MEIRADICADAGTIVEREIKTKAEQQKLVPFLSQTARRPKGQ